MLDLTAAVVRSAKSATAATGAFLWNLPRNILILLLIGAIPSWPYSSGWGYGPSGILGVILVVVLILVLLGRI